METEPMKLKDLVLNTSSMTGHWEVNEFIMCTYTQVLAQTVYLMEDITNHLNSSMRNLADEMMGEHWSSVYQQIWTKPYHLHLIGLEWDPCYPSKLWEQSIKIDLLQCSFRNKTHIHKFVKYVSKFKNSEHFFFKTEAKDLPHALIKQKRVAPLINGKLG